MKELYVKGKKLFKLSDDLKKEIEVCQLVGVSCVLTNIHTNEKIVRLNLILAERNIEVDMPREKFFRREIITELLRKGLSINNCDVDYLINYLFKQEETAPKLYYHTKLGFNRINNSLVYFASKSIGGDVESTHIDAKKMIPSGDYNGWINVIDEEVLGNPELELALTIGYSAMTVGRLSSLVNYSNLLILLHGETSRGKTTALKLIASIYGRPFIGKDGIIRTFDATDNAIMNSMCNTEGFIILQDEGMIRHDKKWNELIYRVESGLERERLTRDIVSRQQREWHSTIVWTSEHELLDEHADNGGLSCRIFQLQKQFTQSAQHSQRIVRGITEHHGHGVVPFAEFLLGYSDDKLKDLYQQSIESLLEKIPQKNHLSSRIIEKLAVLSLTAKILKNNLNISIDTENIDADIIEIHDAIAKSRQSVSEDALDILKEWVIRHKDDFLVQICANDRKRPSDFIYPPNNIAYCGTLIVNANDEVIEIAILTKTLEEIFRHNQLGKVNCILKKWRKEGILVINEKNRLANKRVISGVSTRVYVIQLQPEDRVFLDYDSSKMSKMAEELFGDDLNEK